MTKPATRFDVFFDRYADKIATSLVAILVASSIVFPRAIPFFYLSLALMAAVEIWRTRTAPRAFTSLQLVWTLAGIFVSWCFITVLWSEAPMQAVSKVAFLMATLIAAWVISSWLSQITSSMSKHLKYGLLAGISLGAFYLSVETYFDQPLKMALLNLFDFARDGSSKHFKVINNEIAELPLYFLNRNIATLNILFWPSILLVIKLWKGNGFWLALLVLVSLITIATLQSEHETSKIALLVGAMFFVLSFFLPRLGLKALYLMWGLAILLVLPVSIASYDAKLYKADWLPKSARARIIIWSFTANEYLKHPIIGVGALSTQIVSDADRTEKAKPKGHVLHPQTARHGHNVFLQAWYELGAIGALLLLAVGLAMLKRISALNDQLKPYAIATFGGATMLAAFTWGMWQVWYIAMFALGLAALQIALHQCSENERD